MTLSSISTPHATTTTTSASFRDSTEDLLVNHGKVVRVLSVHPPGPGPSPHGAAGPPAGRPLAAAHPVGEQRPGVQSAEHRLGVPVPGGGGGTGRAVFSAAGAGASQRRGTGHYSGPTRPQPQLDRLNDRVVDPGPVALGQDSTRPLVHVNVRPSEVRPSPQVLHFQRQQQGALGSPSARRVATEFTQRINSSLPRTPPGSPGSDVLVPGRDGARVGLDATAHHRNSQPGTGWVSPGALSISRHVAPAAPPYVVPAVPAPNQAASNNANGVETYEAENNGDAMANDDPRNPFKNHRNSVLYNMYPPRGRPVVRLPPGTGYGTRYFQNGK